MREMWLKMQPTFASWLPPFAITKSDLYAFNRVKICAIFTRHFDVQKGKEKRIIKIKNALEIIFRGFDLHKQEYTSGIFSLSEHCQFCMCLRKIRVAIVKYEMWDVPLAQSDTLPRICTAQSNWPFESVHSESCRQQITLAMTNEFKWQSTVNATCTKHRQTKATFVKSELSPNRVVYRC